jgi:hypothetical protein
MSKKHKRQLKVETQPIVEEQPKVEDQSQVENAVSKYAGSFQEIADVNYQPKVEEQSEVEKTNASEVQLEKELEQEELKKQGENELVKNTLEQVIEVATSDIKNQGRMLNIAINFVKMYKYTDEIDVEDGKNHYFEKPSEDNLLRINSYFGYGQNKAGLNEIFYHLDKEIELTDDHFQKFARTVLVPSLGKNCSEFERDNPYEMRAILTISPTVLMLLKEKHNIKGYRDYQLSQDSDWTKCFSIVKPNTRTPVELILDWDLFKNNESLINKFYGKTGHGIDFHNTFRSNNGRGIQDLAKFYFKPKSEQNKTSEEETKKSSEDSDIYKIVDETCTKLSNNPNFTQGKGKVPNTRRTKEFKVYEQMLVQTLGNLELAITTNKEASSQACELVFKIYEHVIKIMSSKEFNEFMKTITKANVTFSPYINDKEFTLIDEMDGTIIEKDLIKYLKNI